MTLAYSYHDLEVDIWDDFCPECHDYFVSVGEMNPDADFEVLSTRGRSMTCASCGRMISDADLEFRS